MAVFELGSGHVDGTLLVGHHEGDEIAIDVAGRIGHAHVQAHLADGQVIVDYELELGSIAGRSGDVARSSIDPAQRRWELSLRSILSSPARRVACERTSATKPC
jgi:hypothetical protein